MPTSQKFVEPLGQRIERQYLLSGSAPTSVRDTFSTGLTTDNTRPPLLRITYTGTGSNLIKEYRVEGAGNGDVIFHTGTESRDNTGYPLLLECFLWSGVISGSMTGYAGIEYGSFEAVPAAWSNSVPVAQLRQSLADETAWQLVVCAGDGVTPTETISFTVPTSTNAGHRIGLFIDPSVRKVSAIVDGDILATSQDVASFPAFPGAVDDINFGFFMTTGTVTGSSSAQAQWSCARAVSYDVYGAGWDPAG